MLFSDNNNSSSFFYTDVFGLAPAAMATMFLAVRLLDTVTDPIMGE